MSAVLVTGGASGIGLATAHELASAGRAVAIWDLDGDRASAAAEAVASTHGVETVGEGVDVADVAGLHEAADRARSVVGRLVVCSTPPGSRHRSRWTN